MRQAPRAKIKSLHIENYKLGICRGGRCKKRSKYQTIAKESGLCQECALAAIIGLILFMTPGWRVE